MEETLTLMRQTIDVLFSNGKYAGLLIGAIIFMFFCSQKNIKKELRNITILLAVLLVNPFLPQLLMKGFDELEGYWKFLGILPTMVMLAYAFTLVVGGMKDPKKRILLAGIGAVVILLCGTGAFFQSEMGYSSNLYKIPQEELEAIEIIDGYRAEANIAAVMLLAPNEIMEYARGYSGNIKLLYGKDLWNGKILTQMQDGYDEEAYRIFGLMQKPDDFIKEIFNAANLYDCDVLVLPSGMREAETAELGYTIYETTQKYVIYVRE